MPALYWESWSLTSLTLFLIFWLINYLLNRDLLTRCPKTLRAQQDLWPWSSHPWSILKQTCFLIWSLSPAPHLPDCNNVLQEGSQLCQGGKEKSCSPGTAQSLTPGPTQGNGAARQGGWASLAEHPRLCWAWPKPDHCKKLLEFNFFFLGELELVPTETLPGLLPAMPGAATKRRVICQQPNLFPKPGKHLEREKKCGSSYYPFHWILFHNPWRWLFPPSNNLPSCHPSPAPPQIVPVDFSLQFSATPCFGKGCLQPPPPQSSLCSSTQRTSLRKSTFLCIHRERPIASDNGIEWTRRTLSSTISSHKDWAVMRVVKDR